MAYFECKGCGKITDDGIPKRRLCLDCLDELFDAGLIVTCIHDYNCDECEICEVLHQEE